MRADRLEQVFLKRKRGGYELLLVLESAAGARQRVTVSVPPTVATSEQAAMAYLVRWLRGRGAGLAGMLRVRREVAGELEDAPELRQALLEARLGDANDDIDEPDNFNEVDGWR